MKRNKGGREGGREGRREGRREGGGERERASERERERESERQRERERERERDVGSWRAFPGLPHGALLLLLHAVLSHAQVLTHGGSDALLEVLGAGHVSRG